MKKTNTKFGKYFICVAIFVLITAAAVIIIPNLNQDEEVETQYLFKNVKGNHLNFSYTNAKDGIHFIPEGAFCVQIMKIKENENIHNYLKEVQPGISASEVMVGYFETGTIEYYIIENEPTASVTISGKGPDYESYGGYNFINTTLSMQKLLVGNPFAILTTYDGTLDGFGKEIADINSKNNSGNSKRTTDFDEILAYADDEPIYENIHLYMADANQKYYHRSSAFENGSFQFEAIILNPNENILENLAKMIETETEVEITSYDITRSGDVKKIYIVGEDETIYTEKTKELYIIVFSEYDRQMIEQFETANQNF